MRGVRRPVTERSFTDDAVWTSRAPRLVSYRLAAFRAARLGETLQDVTATAATRLAVVPLVPRSLPGRPPNGRFHQNGDEPEERDYDQVEDGHERYSTSGYGRAIRWFLVMKLR